MLYYTIRKSNRQGVPNCVERLPSQFTSARNKSIKILKFESFYGLLDMTPAEMLVNMNQDCEKPNCDECPPNLIIRSDCTEMKSNLAVRQNYDNEIICISGNGFCSGLVYDVSKLNLRELTFSFSNPLFPNIYPIYVVIQLLLEFF
jgi:hypothetical protein